VNEWSLAPRVTQSLYHSNRQKIREEFDKVYNSSAHLSMSK
jgi:hypothetical protein